MVRYFRTGLVFDDHEKTHDDCCEIPYCGFFGWFYGLATSICERMGDIS